MSRYVCENAYMSLCDSVSACVCVHVCVHYFISISCLPYQLCIV